MTNRDPHNSEFVRKNVEFFDCLSNYYKISTKDKLQNDLKKPDINLVCYYELHELRKHSRQYGGLQYNDFVKFENLVEEQKFLDKFGYKV